MAESATRGERCARCGHVFAADETSWTRPTGDVCGSCDRAEANGAPSTIPAHPSTVEDLEKRLRVLREAGVAAYKDGPVEIVFAPKPPPVSEADRLAATFAELEADARKNGGVL